MITRLKFLRFVIGLKSRANFPTNEEQNPIEYTRDFSRALSESQVSTRNSAWFVALYAPVVIRQGNYLDIGFSSVI